MANEVANQIKGTTKRPPADSFLPAETAKEITTVNWTGGHYQHFGKYGPIDLKTLKPVKAKALVAKKFKKLALLKK